MEKFSGPEKSIGNFRSGVGSSIGSKAFKRVVLFVSFFLRDRLSESKKTVFPLIFEWASLQFQMRFYREIDGSVIYRGFSFSAKSTFFPGVDRFSIPARGETHEVL